MTDLKLYQKISSLPDALKSEVNDFVDFLKEKKVSKQSKIKTKRSFGFAKGAIQMSKDFDEPLEDFDDYLK